MFDLNLLPLNYQDGQEQASMPELIATQAPRRVARGRAGDQLVALLNLQGSAPLSPAGQKQLLEQLSQTYYQTGGSVTASLRATVEAINQYLLDRNLQVTSAGRQAVGLINLIITHNDQILLAQCGPTHAFILGGPTVEHVTDPQLAGKGLGLSRTPAIRFYQADASTSKYLILCAEPPFQWSTSLASPGNQTLESIRRKLLTPAQPNLNAVLIQLSPGNGRINFLKNLAAAPVRETAQGSPASVTAQSSGQARRVPAGPTANLPPAAPQRQPAGSSTIEPGRTPPAKVTTGQTPPPPSSGSPAPGKLPNATHQPPVSSSRPAGRPSPGAGVTSQTPSTASTGEPLIQEMKRPRQPNALIQLAASGWDHLQSLFKRGTRTVQTTLAQTLPVPPKPSQGLSTSAMIFIAIAVPLIIVAVTMVVYIKKGQSELYQAAFARAQATANETTNQSDPAVLHQTWEQTLTLLSTAEAYQTTNDTRALRTQAQSSLDSIDGIIRLNFQNAIVGGLDKSVQVTHMVATSGDLYMLDASQGRVIRAVLTGRGYEVDPSFVCGPGKTNATASLTVTPLVSILPLPVNNPFKATILGIDQSGNLLYCIPNQAALAVALPAPVYPWGKITSFVYDSDTLYVLDPANNAVEVYPSTNGTFNDSPHLYFNNPPFSLKDVIDLAVNGQDIYLLHTDGHMSMCTSSQMSTVPTRCNNPAHYTDPRAGRDPNPVTFKDSQLTQILFTEPPDPSIYLLSAEPGSIYHLSLRLNLQNLLSLPPATIASLTSDKATAFTVGMDRSVFLAYGNQIWYASLP